MAEPSIRPLITPENDDEARLLVKRDLLASDRFKREYCPTEKVVLRRRAYEGDPEAFDFPYDSRWGARLVNNWMLRQINHKVGKLVRPPVRLNTEDADGDDSDETRLMMNAVQKRLERKAFEAKWSMGRRKMLLDASKIGYGVRCVALTFDRGKYLVKSFRVRAEEFHMDPVAEGIDDAEWTCWRRYVGGSKLGDTLLRHPEIRPSGAGTSLIQDSRPGDIELSADSILAYGRSMEGKGSAYIGPDPYLVTDYYRKDQAQDFYYPCPACGRYAGVSQVREGEEIRWLFKCRACGHEPKKKPSRDALKRLPRYPHGRHIRIIGPGEVDYNGPCRAKLEDVHPFVMAVWYEGETWNGIGEVQQLAAPTIYNMVAMNMLADNAFSGAHSKVQVPKDGIEGGWNNNPDDPLIMSSEAWASGGAKTLPPADISASARILLDRSLEDQFLLAANSPESQGQAPDTVRSGVGIARIVAASEVGLLLTNESLIEADARFYRLLRDYLAQIDTPAQIPMIAPDGRYGSYQYDRSLMGPNVQITIRTGRDVDQEREELFSRSVELRGMGVPEADNNMLLELSGIPEDIVQRARERAEVIRLRQENAGLAPAIGGASQGPPAPAANGNGSEGPALPAAVAQRIAGSHAPKQVRPPARSRGAITPEAPFSGAGR